MLVGLLATWRLFNFVANQIMDNLVNFSEISGILVLLTYFVYIQKNYIVFHISNCLTKKLMHRKNRISNNAGSITVNTFYEYEMKQPFIIIYPRKSSQKQGFLQIVLKNMVCRKRIN